LNSINTTKHGYLRHIHNKHFSVSLYYKGRYIINRSEHPPNITKEYEIIQVSTLSHHPDYGHSMLLWISSQYIQGHIGQHPRRYLSSYFSPSHSARIKLKSHHRISFIDLGFVLRLRLPDYDRCNYWSQTSRVLFHICIRRNTEKTEGK
jgi:hypothetical protein